MSKPSEVPPAVDGWVYLAHPDIDAAPVRVPDDPTAVEHQVARGWVRVPAPEEPAVVVPDPGEQLPADAVDDGWVELEHPDLDGRRHRFPADAAAIGLAEEAGWRRPAPGVDEPVDEPEHAPAKQTKRTSRAADSKEE